MNIHKPRLASGEGIFTDGSVGFDSRPIPPFLRLWWNWQTPRRASTEVDDRSTILGVIYLEVRVLPSALGGRIVAFGNATLQWVIHRPVAGVGNMGARDPSRQCGVRFSAHPQKESTG